jgi:hypothetical protein
VVWRAADLLGVSARDRIELKHTVAARQPAPVKDGSDGAGAAT